MDEMKGLLQTAKTFVASAGTTQCTWFYRNKPLDYFTKITSDHEGLMNTRLKDATGDLRAPINGEIKGLFFMTAVDDNGEPLPFSPFGDARILMRPEVLLSRATNVYFADFYCMSMPSAHRPGRHWHQITLVLARPGSDADILCQERLPKLDIHDRTASPFLFVENGEVNVLSIKEVNVMVELFFTEDIEVAELLKEGKAEMKYDIPLIGPGRSSQGGRRKCSECDICRTKPITTTESSFWTF